VSLGRVLRLLFERRGARMETPSQVVYWVNTDGLSLPNRRLLTDLPPRFWIKANNFQGLVEFLLNGVATIKFIYM
jgi:hypothetical protein